jgi:non-ribosomal peptide synthetase-like protein
VHIHHGVNLLEGGWDLLDIGADVTLSQDAALHLVEYEDGQIVLGPVTLGAGSTLEAGAGVGGHTCLESNAYLTAMSFLPRHGWIPHGELWDGIPARSAGRAPLAPDLPARGRELSPFLHGLALSLGRSAVDIFQALPATALTLVLATMIDADAEAVSDWIFHPVLNPWVVLLVATLVVAAVPLTLLFETVIMRGLGRVPRGAISRWSPAYIRVLLKTELTASASQWLNGSLLWPTWLRWAGMNVGRGCEISTIIDTIPEMVELGAESFLADSIYLAGPKVHRGTVTLAPARLGKSTYFGNYAVIPAGQTLPDGILLGVGTVADETLVRPGTSWFGHPPFELPKREIVACDRRFTFAPGWPAYLNRVFWEWLRFAIPLVPLFLAVGWFVSLWAAEPLVSLPVLLLCVIPALEVASVAVIYLLNLVLKWGLLGRVKPGVHPLWSCWCRRWEFHYAFQGILVAGPLAALGGTLLLNWYLRAMGMKIGRHVVLGGDYAGIIDFDMLTLEDGATVNCFFQAHTFEDRVLKIDRVRIRREATVGNAVVLLYGADIGERTYVLPHSVVMKDERLLADQSYAGCPTRPMASSEKRLQTASVECVAVAERL